MPRRLLSMSEVAKESMVPRYRISYALERGQLKEPPRLNGRRCFSNRDLEAIRNHFGRGVQHDRR